MMNEYKRFRQESADSILRTLVISEPSIDPFVIAEKLGAKLFVVRDVNWDGALEVKDDPCVYIKGGINLNKQRLMCAYALGCLIWCELGVTWRLSDDNVPKEAYIFAQELLMPSWMMKLYVPIVSYEDLPKLFGVSKHTMSVRLSDLNLYARPNPIRTTSPKRP